MEEQNKKEHKLMIKISINGEGQIGVTSAISRKEFIVNLLADALKLAAMQPDNVVKVPPDITPQGLKAWVNRKKGKR